MLNGRQKVVIIKKIIISLTESESYSTKIDYKIYNVPKISRKYMDTIKTVAKQQKSLMLAPLQSKILFPRNSQIMRKGEKVSIGGYAYSRDLVKSVVVNINGKKVNLNE